MALIVTLLVASEAFAADVRNCLWCHGTSAQGYTVAPRIAGQRAAYLANQLRNYARHSRDNPTSRQYMWNAAANLRPDAIGELADYFASLPRKPAQDGRKELLQRGERIYALGIPEANIVACFACHGPAGEGIRQIPRLGGMSYHYLKRRLQEWSQGFHASAAPMPVIARSLGPEEVEALASYLSFAEDPPERNASR